MSELIIQYRMVSFDSSKRNVFILDPKKKVVIDVKVDATCVVLSPQILYVNENMSACTTMLGYITLFGTNHFRTLFSIKIVSIMWLNDILLWQINVYRKHLQNSRRQIEVL